MLSQKLSAGSVFPSIDVTLLSGESVNLSQRDNTAHWKLVVVYRGQHCPLCTQYLNELEQHVNVLRDTGVEIIAVSADTQEQLTSHTPQLHVSFPLAYGLSVEHMKTLGLYISTPRSAQETDHVFAEPGLFIINETGQLQVIDIANGPFARPNLATLVAGIQWIKDPKNNYPIRGTFNTDT
ncbi:redoxin domain-containing protein [Marinagarivorans algicola]|uniref:redoxin domain-containing protein n=1 Tax=Marinagarivorans algicola TaxID=1513270 RepID=UPI0006B4E4A1|nr:redoxin domain-containing protein [Marinagarivorans algicola]